MSKLPPLFFLGNALLKLCLAVLVLLQHLNGFLDSLLVDFPTHSRNFLFQSFRLTPEELLCRQWDIIFYCLALFIGHIYVHMYHLLILAIECVLVCAFV